MSVIIDDTGTVALGRESGALFLAESSVGGAFDPSVKGSGPKKTLPATDTKERNIAIWGEDNLLPQRMAKDIAATGVLSAGIEAKARIAVGKGPRLARVVDYTKDGYEKLQFVKDPVIEEWMDASRAFESSLAVVADLYRVGNAFVQHLLSADRKNIVAFKRTDPCQARVEAMNETSLRSENVFLSADWEQYNNPETGGKHIVDLPLLDPDFPLLDLQQCVGKGRDVAYMQHLRYPLFNRNYYALPPWWPAYKWVKIAQGIPEMKEAMFKNQITVKYLITVDDGYWTKAHPGYDDFDVPTKLKTRASLYDSIEEYLVGGKNAYKSIFSPSWMNPDGKLITGITITPIDDKIKDGKLLPDSAAANSEILFALMINPALMGADTPGGPYSGGAGSGSNIREAYLVQVMLMEVERVMNSQVFDLAKRFNRWDPTLVWRYPNQILTTLNTGKNTQPTA